MSMKLKSRSKNSTKEADLLEQIKLLTIENETLRTFIAKNNITNVHEKKETKENGQAVEKRTMRQLFVNTDNPTTSHVPLTAAKGCSCKGNCSTRVCGCIKKNIPCGESCRCGEMRCQNLEVDKENIGESNNQTLSKDAEERVPNQSKLILRDKEGSKEKAAKVNRVNKRVELSKDASTLEDNVGEIEFESLSLQFGEDNGAEAGKSTTKDGESTRVKANATKKSKNQKNKKAESIKANNTGAAEKLDDRLHSNPSSEEVTDEVERESHKNPKTKVKRNVKATSASRKQDNEVDSEEIGEGDQENEHSEPEPTAKGKRKREKIGKAKTATEKRNKRAASEEMPDENKKKTETKATSAARKRNNRRNSDEKDQVVSHDNEQLVSDAGPANKNEKKAAGATTKRNNRINRKQKDEINTTNENENTAQHGSNEVIFETDKMEAVEMDELSSINDNYIEGNRRNETENREEEGAIIEARETKKRMKKMRETYETIEENYDSDFSPTDPTTSSNRSFETETLLNLEAAGDFNPMKPRRQLSRSPIGPTDVFHPQRILDPSEILLPIPVTEKLDEEIVSPPAELEKDIVDWDEHQANLVKCSKCSRTFHLHRIKKHERFCQKI